MDLLLNLLAKVGILPETILSKIITVSIKIVFIFVMVLIVVKIIKLIMNRRILLTKITVTQANYIRYLLVGLVYFFGIITILFSIPGLEKFTTTLVAGSGILALVIGFASQEALSNVVSGILIAIFRPFEVNDVIKLKSHDIIGVVEDIDLRDTMIKTFDNKRVIVPNSVINTEVIENATIHEKEICKFFEIGISYDSDIDKAKLIIKEETLKHPLFFDNRTKKEKDENVEPVKIKVINLGNSSVDIRAWIWTKDFVDAFNLGCDLNEIIKKRFDKEGIEIPFPHTTVVMKNN
ncbi:MAG: mechanosensitive ion channel family protein [Candidatus Marinimicrobia bacterium]|nr:mechanosensitive ion channel family protein [Candidatus Neomarinimicrobiota bacterium]